MTYTNVLKKLVPAIALAWAGQAQAISLWEAYSKALEHDPVYRVALADYKAGQEEEIVGRSALLPQVSLSWYEGKSNADRTAQTALGPQTNSIDYDIKNLQLQIRQALINQTAWAGARQGSLIAQQARVKALGARDDLTLRVTTAYFQVLSTINNLDLATAEEKANSERLKEIQLGLKAGISSEVELAQAKARADLKKAEKIKFRDQLDIAFRALEDLVGSPISSIEVPKEEIEPLLLEGDNSFSGLQTLALRQNYNVLSAAFDLQIAREELEKAKGAHYPTLDFIATKQDSESESLTTIGQTTDQETLALQLQVPIFNGFGTQARAGKAFEMSNRAMARWESVVKSTLYDLRTKHNVLVSADPLIKAYRNSIVSAQKSLEASTKGRQLGFQTLNDVLDAETELALAKREYARVQFEKYGAAIELQSLAGQLRANLIKKVSDYISSKSETYELERAPLPAFNFQDPTKLPLPSPDELDAPVIIKKPAKKEEGAKASDALDISADAQGEVTYKLKPEEGESAVANSEQPAPNTSATADAAPSDEPDANAAKPEESLNLVTEHQAATAKRGPRS